MARLIALLSDRTGSSMIAVIDSERSGQPLCVSGIDVHVKPIGQHVIDDFAELDEVDWLEDITVRAASESAIDVAVFRRGCQDDNRHESQFLAGSNPLQHFQATDLGEAEIKQNKIRRRRILAIGMSPLAQQEFEGFLSVVRDRKGNLALRLAHSTQHQVLLIAIVFDHKNLF
jgi:hypothetical protein